MTIYYPDISGFQSGIHLTGAIAVACKATEGSGFINPDYASAKARAASAGSFFFAYHFLSAGNAAGQAQHCFNVVGKTPLMVDFEPSGTRPTVADATAFIDAFRKLGGICYLLYLPRWYWSQLGSPSLAPFINRGMFLVSSEYTSYSDSGPGWSSYGGMTPLVWQYADSVAFNGFNVDFNAFKGSLAEFISVVSTGKAGGNVADPVLTRGATGPEVVKLQTRLNVWGAKLTVDGSFGPATQAAVNAFQLLFALTPDGVVGPATWAVLNKAPVAPKPVPGPAAPVPYHGEYIAGGMFDLADLASKLGVGTDGPATLLRMTASHYGTFGNDLGALLRDILTGVKPWNAPVPAGVKLWCD